MGCARFFYFLDLQKSAAKVKKREAGNCQKYEHNRKSGVV